MQRLPPGVSKLSRRQCHRLWNTIAPRGKTPSAHGWIKQSLAAVSCFQRKVSGKILRESKDAVRPGSITSSISRKDAKQPSVDHAPTRASASPMRVLPNGNENQFDIWDPPNYRATPDCDICIRPGFECRGTEDSIEPGRSEMIKVSESTRHSRPR